MKAVASLTDLPHLSALLYGRAHLIAPTKLETILRVVETRAVLEAGAGKCSNTSRSDYGSPEDAVTGSVAVIPVLGTLVNRHSHVSAASGLMSYGEVSHRLKSALDDPHVQAILLDIDSSGGEASGCFDLADQIYAARQIKPIWASVNDTALSAAYAIASACERICVSRTGSVGSIGVVAAHVDQSIADQKAGLKYSFISAGDHKIDGNPHEPLRPEVEAQIQNEVNRIYGLFVETVAHNRSLDSASIQNTEAAIYGGGEGINVGLADAVQPFAVTLSELSAQIQNQNQTNITEIKKEPSRMDDANSHEEQDPQKENPTIPIVSQATAPTSSTKTHASQTTGTTADQIPQPQIPNANHTSSAQSNEALETSLRAEFAEISAIADQAQKLGLSVDVAKALESRTSPMALRKRVLDQLASRDAASLVVATPEAQAGVGDPNANIGGSLKAAAEAEAKAMMGETQYG